MPHPRALIGIAAASALLAVLLVLWLASRPSPSAAALRARNVDAASSIEPSNAGARPETFDAGRAAAPAREAAAIGSPASAAEPVVPAGSIRGRVTTAGDDAPIAGAEVRLALVRGDTQIDLGSVRTAGDGRFASVSSSLAALTSIERATAQVTAIAFSAAGAGETSQHVVDELNRVDDLDVALFPGSVVRGRVVDARGNAAVLARVLLSPRMRGGEFRCDESGAFAIAAVFGVPAGSVLWARDAAHGCASVDVPASEQGAIVDCGAIVLRELEVLAGRLVAADGSPIPGAHVRARRVVDPQAREPERGELVHWGDDRVYVAGANGETLPALKSFFDGVDEGDAWTDEHGRFRIAGLAAGTYSFHALGPHANDFESHALRDADDLEIFRTGSLGLELVSQATWLVVQVLDTSGAALPGIDVEYVRLGGGDDDPPEAWQTLSLARADARMALPLHSRRMALYAEAGGATTGEHIVDVPKATLRRETLVLEPIGPGARVRARVTLPDGGECRDYTLVLRSRATGRKANSFSWFETDDDGRSPELPPGTYDYEVVLDGAALARFPYALPIRGSLSLEAGGEVEVALVFELGGRLAIRATTALDDGVARGASLRLVDALGAVVAISSPSMGMGGWDRRPQRGRGLLLGTRVEFSEVLAPGSYTLRVEAPDCEPAERAVSITRAARTEVELELVPLSER